MGFQRYGNYMKKSNNDEMENWYCGKRTQEVVDASKVVFIITLVNLFIKK